MLKNVAWITGYGLKDPCYWKPNYCNRTFFRWRVIFSGPGSLFFGGM